MNATLKLGRGVLGKDGQPFMAGTLWVTGKSGFKSQIQFTISAALAAVADDEIVEVQLIDVDNRQYTLKLARAK